MTYTPTSTSTVAISKHVEKPAEVNGKRKIGQLGTTFETVDDKGKGVEWMEHARRHFNFT
jgi:hypothetical protein